MEICFEWPPCFSNLAWYTGTNATVAVTGQSLGARGTSEKEGKKDLMIAPLPGRCERKKIGS